MIAVLDANIALALLVELPYSAAARAALATATTALAPDLVLYESANALWRIANAGEMEEAACQEVLARLPLLFDELVPAHDLGGNALAAAIAQRHPAYDCFYSVLAAQRGATLVTADRKFADKLRTAGTTSFLFVE